MRSHILAFACSVTLSYVSHVAATPSPAMLEKRLPSLNSYTFQDCYYDHPEDEIQVLFEEIGASSRMTLERCASACESYTYFGVRGSAGAAWFCLCGDVLRTDPPTQVLDDLLYCTSPCPGNPSQRCGGSTSLSLWKKNDDYVAVAPPPPTYLNVGCFRNADGQNYILGGADVTNFNVYGLTRARCEDICNGYKFYALSIDNCQCSNTLVTAAEVTNSDECDAPCTGQPDTLCGGFGRFSIYTNSPPCAKLDTPLRVRNPGFESGVAYWDTSILGDGIKWTSREGSQASGKRAARFDVTSTTSYIYIYQMLELCMEFPYMLSLYSRQASADAGCTIIVSYGALGIGLGNQIRPLTTTYQKFEGLVIDNIPGIKALGFQINCDGTPSSNSFRTAFVDNVELRPATAAEVVANS